MKRQTKFMMWRIVAYVYVAVVVYSMGLGMTLGTMSMYRGFEIGHATDQMHRAKLLVWDVDYCMKWYGQISYPLSGYMIREGLNNARPRD